MVLSRFLQSNLKMKCFLLSVLWSIFWLFPDTADAQRTTLYMGYITTITGSFQASGGRPAVDMALALINERDDILQNYTLTYTDVLDSGVISNSIIFIFLIILVQPYKRS